MRDLKKEFAKIKIIWGGAKWSNFVRYWLGIRRTSVVFTAINKVRVAIARKKFEKQTKNVLAISQKIKPGVFDVPDLRDFKVYSPRIPKKFELPLETHNWELSQREATDQKQTMRCSAYGGETAKGIMDSIEKGVPIYHDPIELWNHQLVTGASEEKGDYIQNMLKNMLKFGFINNRKSYRITEYRRLEDKSVKALQLWLALGKVVVTGIFVRKDEGYGTNYARAEFDDYGVLRISEGQIIGGHLQCCCDYKTLASGIWFRFPNTYGKEWGNADGCVWIHESEINHTMSKYILFDDKDKIDSLV